MPVSVNAAYLNEWTVDSWFYNSVYRYLSELFKYKVWRFTVKSELETPPERRIEHIFVSNVQNCRQCGVGSRSPAFCFCYDVLQIKLRSQCSKSSVQFGLCKLCRSQQRIMGDHGKEVPFLGETLQGIGQKNIYIWRHPFGTEEITGINVIQCKVFHYLLFP